MWFWIYAYHWLNQLYGYITKNARIILWLGIVGAIFLIVYVDYLGTEGEINRFMRRYGIMIFFTFTPLAQLLLLGQHYKILPAMQEKTLHPRALQYQTIVLLLMLVIGIISIILNLSQRKTYETENIVEWNFSFLLYMYYVGMIFIWKNFRCNLRHGSDRG